MPDQPSRPAGKKWPGSAFFYNYRFTEYNAVTVEKGYQITCVCLLNGLY